MFLHAIAARDVREGRGVGGGGGGGGSREIVFCAAGAKKWMRLKADFFFLPFILFWIQTDIYFSWSTGIPSGTFDRQARFDLREP